MRGISQKNKGESGELRKALDINLWPPHVYAHMHTHIHMTQKKWRREGKMKEEREGGSNNPYTLTEIIAIEVGKKPKRCR